MITLKALVSCYNILARSLNYTCAATWYNFYYWNSKIPWSFYLRNTVLKYHNSPKSIIFKYSCNNLILYQFVNANIISARKIGNLRVFIQGTFKKKHNCIRISKSIVSLVMKCVKVILEVQTPYTLGMLYVRNGFRYHGHRSTDCDHQSFHTIVHYNPPR